MRSLRKRLSENTTFSTLGRGHGEGEGEGKGQDEGQGEGKGDGEGDGEDEGEGEDLCCEAVEVRVPVLPEGLPDPPPSLGQGQVGEKWEWVGQVYSRCTHTSSTREHH